MSAPDVVPVAWDVSASMRKAFSLGQKYWQQSDSDFVSQHKKSDATFESFNVLTAEAKATVDAMQAQIDELASNPHSWKGALEGTILKMGERIDALGKDAARYRWLRSRLPGGAYRIEGVVYSEGGAGVDADVDAAMKANP